MKLMKFTCVLTFGLVLALGSSGCKHRTPPVTHVGGAGGQTGGGQGEPGSGGKLPGAGGESSTPGAGGGLAQGPGHPGWPENADIFKSDTVYFDFDSSVIKPGEKSKISAVADYLKSNAEDALKIEGHCDERGTEEYNRALGERRALALREELANLGVEATRVDTISYGKDRPADQGHDESAWSKNRRGVFILLTPPGK
jgi:peptidoglycan-associated lipoprotein